MGAVGLQLDRHGLSMNETIATYTVFFRDAAIGEVELRLSEGVGIGGLTESHPFDAIRSVLADASRAQDNYGFLPPPGQATGGVNVSGDRDGAAVMARADAYFREMELRDEQGRGLSTNSLTLFGGRTPTDPFVVFVTFDPPDGSSPGVTPGAAGREP